MKSKDCTKRRNLALNNDPDLTEYAAKLILSDISCAGLPSSTMNTPLESLLRLPQQGTIRAAPLAALPGVMRELGVDLQPIVAAQGLSWRVFEDPDESIAYRTLCTLLAACVRASGCPHLGLLVGRGGGVSTLGALGYLIQNTPDVRTAPRHAHQPHGRARPRRRPDAGAAGPSGHAAL
jgi:hypothetical protein